MRSWELAEIIGLLEAQGEQAAQPTETMRRPRRIIVVALAGVVVFTALCGAIYVASEMPGDPDGTAQVAAVIALAPGLIVMGIADMGIHPHGEWPAWLSFVVTFAPSWAFWMLPCAVYSWKLPKFRRPKNKSD
jgi:hypothetical protein